MAEQLYVLKTVGTKHYWSQFSEEAFNFFKSVDSIEKAFKFTDKVKAFLYVDKTSSGIYTNTPVYQDKDGNWHEGINILIEPAKQMEPPKKKNNLINEHFIELAKKLKMLDKVVEQNIKEQILQGTSHSSLLSYQQDYSIDYATKLSKYSYWLGVINANEVGVSKGIETKIPQTHDEIVAATLKLQESLLHNKAVEESFNKQLAEFNKQIKHKRVETLIIKHPNEVIVELDQAKELFHKQLPLMCKLLTCRNAIGWTEFLYIWGAPGAGKTHMARQLARLLNVKSYTYPCGPTITEGKVLGYNNVVSGTFIKGWLYEAYKNGGLVALDEIDLCDASVLGATNSIENDRYCFGNDEFVDRHRDFYLIAFANTMGTGSTKGFTRNVLDAATRDRFTQIKLEYDEQLETELFGNANWASYVISVRKYVTEHMGSSMYITPRATRKGAAYLKGGIDPDTVCDIVIFKTCSADQKETIIKNVGRFQPNVTVTVTKDEGRTKEEFKMNTLATPWISSITEGVVTIQSGPNE